MVVFCKFAKIEHFKFAYLGRWEGGRGGLERNNSDGRSKQDFYQSSSQAEFTPACPEDLPM